LKRFENRSVDTIAAVHAALAGIVDQTELPLVSGGHSFRT